jgi:hypothetical protein
LDIGLHIEVQVVDYIVAGNLEVGTAVPLEEMSSHLQIEEVDTGQAEIHYL